MDLTAMSRSDASAAREASEIWGYVLGPYPAPADGAGAAALPDGILAASHALHGASLARIGRDGEAAAAYGRALGMRDDLTAESIREAAVGRGRALQRLTRYGEAADQFRSPLLGGGATDGGRAGASLGGVGAEAVRGAATCALRLGDAGGASEVLREYSEGRGWEAVSEWDGDVAGILGALLLTADDSARNGYDAIELLRHAARTSVSPLYGWLLQQAVAGPSHPYAGSSDLAQSTEGNEEARDREEEFLNLAAVNQSPFDDASLIQLDDKVFLHRLMTERTYPDSSMHDTTTDTSHFFPVGFILPDDVAGLEAYLKMRQESNDSQPRWILKERAGYGSYGNRIVTSAEALRFVEDARGSAEDKNYSVLCQDIVDPPLLIDGRKFSLRVYVIYFSGGDEDVAATGSNAEGRKSSVYISTEGLAKLAAAPYNMSDANAGIDDAYMTNSGRGEGSSMDQLDFRQLRAELGRECWDGLWEEIEDAVLATMRRYRTVVERTSMEDSAVSIGRISSQLVIPKILGFDFLVDSHCAPWLIEANRFPGLEPRGRCDEAVKRRVVRDAWRAASQIAGVSCEVVGIDESEGSMPSSLKILDLW